jgi:D-sedoheptulose 7-phosphate isomerase
VAHLEGKRMNRVDKIYEVNREPSAFAKEYLAYIGELLRTIDADAIARVIDCFEGARRNGKKIFFAGNGGSAATASHFANDLAIGPRLGEASFKAVALTDNVAILTAIGNDFGYDEIFVKQLEVLMEPGDVVVVISASGNSTNVVKALEYANRKGNPTVALTGFSGGRIKELATLSVLVQTAKGEYGPVEDAHMVLDHLIGAFFCRSVKA